MIDKGGAGDARSNREVQRFEHLVLGRPRPEATPSNLVKPKGMPNREWKVERKRLIAAGAELAPGIEQAVQLRERWSHRAGTPETHEHASRTQQGALARLHLSGAISADQLAWSVEIAEAAAMILAGIGTKTASLETRVDVTRMGDGIFHEALGRVWSEMAYSRWRARAQGPIDALIDIIVRDIGVTIAARRHRMSVRRMRKLLTDALDLWPQIFVQVRKEVDPATLAAAHAGIL